jgi:hypothetical protein
MTPQAFAPKWRKVMPQRAGGDSAHGGGAGGSAAMGGGSLTFAVHTTSRSLLSWWAWVW